jgi:Mlc titration factor MtfA (ptsG expression regulator)
MFGFKRRQRRRLRERPFPPEWREIIERNVPYYRMLSADQQQELRGHIQVFLHEKRFEGCGGLAITDEMRVMIAAHACRLLLHRTTDYFPKAGTILMYPSRYFVEAERRLPGGVVSEGLTERHGESWYRGPVILSWEDVQRLAQGWPPGRNVVLHEFAHQLDSESGAVEGAPGLPEPSMYAAWAQVFGREYERLRAAVAQRRPAVLDPYGATSPAEFFAVATEAFFEQSAALKQGHPELYEQLKLFYQQDPAARTPA